MGTSFKQRENIEMYLKACATYGLKEQDLFQVNDLFETKNPHLVVDNIYALGGVKVASENKRNFDEDVLIASKSMIGQQYGTNTLASQSGMTATGARRQIN